MRRGRVIFHSKWLRFGLTLVVALAMILGLFPHGVVQAQQSDFSRFDEVDCSQLNLQTTNLLSGLNLRCGWLTVPEEHANPSGRTIQLAVVIIRSQSANPAPDPLVMMQGGPGGSTIDTYTQLIPLDPRLKAMNRDIVLFDQRGTKYSKPSLFCQAYYDEAIRQLNEALSLEESNRRANAALKTCYDQFTQAGINLSAYDTLENAADVESLRQALGYNKINLYGVSYGTEVVLQYERSFPQSLRSATIDSVLPPQINFIQDSPSASQRALEAVFSACGADAACNKAYPNLKQVFYQQVEALNKEKAQIQVTDPQSGQVYPALLDGYTFINGIIQMLYVTDMVPLVPRVIYQVHDQDYAFLERILALTVFDQSINMGMYFSVVCSEDINIDPQRLDLSGMQPELATYEKAGVAAVAQTCSFWKVEPLDDAAHQPVSSNVPNLVLAGAFDPATPPAYAEEAARSLPNSTYVLFPAGGHGQVTSGECQDHIFLQFLDAPTQKPVTTCVSQQQVVFSVPGSLVRLPKLVSLLNLQGEVGVQAAVYALALLFLLSTLAVYPIAWLWRVLRASGARPVTTPPATGPYSLDQSPAATPAPRAPLLYRLAPWMAVITAASLLAIIIVVYVNGYQMALANDSRVLLGLPGSTRPAFLLPLMAAALTVLMLVGAVSAWRQRAGSGAGKVYLTLLCLAALVCLVILGMWGILTAYFTL